MSVLLDLNFIQRVVPSADIIGQVSGQVLFATDSRMIKHGELFVALQGNRVDGHDYISDALKNGAAGVVINKKKQAVLDSLPCDVRQKLLIIMVENPLAFIIELARSWRQTFSIPVIGVTGSIGKTSTKELLTNILIQSGKKVLYTEGNQNTVISCALSVLKMAHWHEVAVFEMGISRRGEMLTLASIVQPTTALITAIGHSHAEGLGSLSDIAMEKRAIFSFFKENSIGIINGDTPLLSSISYKHPVIKFGFKTTNQIQARKVQINGLSLSCIIKIYDKRYKVTIPTHHTGRLLNILAAITAADLLGVSHDIIMRVIQEPLVVKGRFEIKKLKKVSGMLINDCYNASPESMRAALIAFEALPTQGKKIAVLGDMLELGLTTSYWHRQLGRLVAKVPTLSHVIFVGKHVALACKTAPYSLTTEHVATWQEAVERIEALLEPETTVLVKASRGIQLDRFVDVVAE